MSKNTLVEQLDQIVEIEKKVWKMFVDNSAFYSTISFKLVFKRNIDTVILDEESRQCAIFSRDLDFYEFDS